MLRLFCLFLLAASGAVARSSVPPEERIVVLISIDGMRWDYLERFAPPRLSALAAEGVTAGRLNPTFPSRTFPNQYTIVTGLRPQRHGIVNNEMFDPASGRWFRGSNPGASGDPSWWGGEPIWVTAQRQGRRSACMFWPGSEAPIGGVRPTFWYRYDHGLPTGSRVAQVLAWLDLPPEERPAVITVYFAQVDDAAHRHGPESAEARDGLHEIDTQIGVLLDGIATRRLADRVHLVVTSDHGMTEISPDRIVFLDDVIALADVQIDFSGPLAGVRPLHLSIEACVAKLQRLPHVRVVPKTELAPSLGYDHPRIPDVLILPDEGWRVYTRQQWANNKNPNDGGEHGYDSAYGSMGATLIAWGSAFRKGERIQAVDNVHIYELLCATLGLKPAPNDGDDRLTRVVLAE